LAPEEPEEELRRLILAPPGDEGEDQAGEQRLVEDGDGPVPRRQRISRSAPPARAGGRGRGPRRAAARAGPGSSTPPPSAPWGRPRTRCRRRRPSGTPRRSR